MKKLSRLRCSKLFYRVVVETVEHIVLHFAVRVCSLDAFFNSISDTFPLCSCLVTGSFRQDSVKRDWFLLL